MFPLQPASFETCHNQNCLCVLNIVNLIAIVDEFLLFFSQKYTNIISHDNS